MQRQMIGRSVSLAVVLAGCLAASVTTAQDHWPRFRGPAASGVAADDPRLPDSWSATENVAWSTPIPGWGWSCPVVWGNKVFLTTVVSDEESEKPKKGLYLGFGRREPPPGGHHWLVYCLALDTGEVLWKHEAHVGRPKVPRHPKSTYAAETPVTDGQRLYALFGDLGLYCYDLDGKPLWSVPIEPRKTMFDYGAAASPVVHDGRVIMVYDNQDRSYIAAYGAEDGQLLWRTERDEKSTWATPFVWQNELRTEIVTPGKKKNRSYDLSGKLLWEFDGKMSNLVIPSPFAAHGLLYLASGYIGDPHRPVYAIRPGAAGDFTPAGEPAESPFIAWYQPTASPYNPSPLVYGDYYYTLLDRGFVTCHDARTGREIYGKTRIFAGATFTASPWAYNGMLFFLSEDGATYVAKAGPEFELLRTNSLDELAIATPSVAQGKLLIRTASKLYCLTDKGN